MEELMITSGFNFEGYKITKYIGFYSGECALGTGFLSSLDAGLADIFGSNSSVYEEKLSKAKLEAISELKNLAVKHGANAIIGIDVNYTTFSADIMGVVANGTAVKIEKISDYNDMISNKVNGDRKNISFPIISYYENITIRPYNLFMDLSMNMVKLYIYNYKEEKLNAMNVDIIANTIFGTFYEYEDLNFTDFNIEDNVLETEEIFLNINNNQLKVIESITLKINYYILNEKVYSLGEPYQVSNMKKEQLLEFRKSYGEDVVSDFHDDSSYWICMCGCKNDTNTNKCFICERNKNEYTRAKNRKVVDIGSLMTEIINFRDCQEILSYLKKIELKHGFQFPDKIMNDVKKMSKLEKAYGNMKDSLIDIMNKYVLENE